MVKKEKKVNATKAIFRFLSSPCSSEVTSPKAANTHKKIWSWMSCLKFARSNVCQLTTFSPSVYNCGYSKFQKAKSSHTPNPQTMPKHTKTGAIAPSENHNPRVMSFPKRALMFSPSASNSRATAAKPRKKTADCLTMTALPIKTPAPMSHKRSCCNLLLDWLSSKHNSQTP